MSLTLSLSVYVSLPPSFSPSPILPTPIFSLEISLRRLSAGKLVTSAGLRQQLSSPALTTDGGERSEWRGWVGEPGGRKRW